jgi:AraC-like DNA-binding protein
MGAYKKIILEIDVDHVEETHEEAFVHKCKALFERIMRKFSASSVKVSVAQPAETVSGLLPFFITERGNRLCVNQSVIDDRWPDLPQQKFVTRSIELVLLHLDEDEFNTYSLATEMHLSKASFYRKMKLFTKVSAKEFIRIVRMQAAFQLLSQRSFTVSEVAWKCGYSSVRHFSKLFYKTFKTLPSRM